MRALFCGVGVALTLTGCELLEQLRLGAIDEDTEPAAQVSFEPLEEHHGKRFIPLTGGRLLHCHPIFRVVDLRNPSRPRVEATLDRLVTGERLFQLGDHVIYLTGGGTIYRGEREDVDLPRVRPSALLNVDIRDPSAPTLINEVPVHAAAFSDGSVFMRQGPGQSGPAIFVVQTPDNPDAGPRLCRYELQDEQLVRTGQLDVPPNVEVFEVSENKLLLAMPAYNKPTRVMVVDGTGAELRAVLETSVEGESAQLLTTEGVQLRVAYTRGTNPTIDTFDLTKPAARARIGRCELEGWEGYSNSFEGTLLSRRDHTLYATSVGGMYQIPFNAVGKCPATRSFGGDSHSEFLHMPDAQRLLTLQGAELKLFDTSPDASVPELARLQLTENMAWSEAARPIQVFNLQRPAVAADGTPEPWLVGVPYYDYWEIPRARFDLFSASRQTLTLRSGLSELGFAGDLVLYDNTLVTLASSALRTYDIRDLEAPRELGKLDLGAYYNRVIQFRDHVVRVEGNVRQGPPEGTSAPQELQVVHLDKTNEPPGATWSVEESSLLFKAEDLLLEANWNYSGLQDPQNQLKVQVHDLSDPARPRAAASFEGFSEPASLYRAQMVGQSLVLAMRKRSPGRVTRECTKSISHVICAPWGDDSSCSVDYWTGYTLCTTIDGGPESCVLSGLNHCVSNGCTSEDEIPPEAILQEVYCNERTETIQGPMALAAIDFTDADRPVVAQPYLELPNDNPRAWFDALVAGNMLYRHEQSDDVTMATAIDFADPYAPKVSGPHTLPGPIREATATALYTARYEDASITLSRVAASALGEPPTAARTWPGRTLWRLRADDSGQTLYFTHLPSGEQPAGADPRSAWLQLEVLDALTLETLGKLDIDKKAEIVSIHDGRLFLEINGALLVVDVRDRIRPRAQAAVLFPYGSTLVANDDKFYVLEGDRTHRYPIDLQNLRP